MIKRAYFSNLSYQKAIYDSENKRILIEEPRLFLVLEIKERLNNSVHIFDIYEDVCQAWQFEYPFSSKPIIEEIKSEFRNKTFMLNEDMSLNKQHLNKLLIDFFEFEFKPSKFALKYAYE